MTSVVGIDIAKSSFEIATLQPNDKYRTKGNLPNNSQGFQALDAWLAKYAMADAWVIMEATGVYHLELAEHFYRLGYRIAVINPACISSYAKSQLQRVKTDKVDAKLIALYGQRHVDELHAWQPEPLAQRRLRALVRRLEDLKELEQMECNRLDVSDASVQTSIRSVIQHLEQEIAATLQAIKDHIDDDPDLHDKRDLLVSINGISDKTAALILAELGDPLRFRDSRAVVAFAGLNPRLQESGRHKGRVRISRMGSASLRSGLYMPALVAMTHNPAIKALSERLKAKGKPGKQIVCAAMRKLLNIAYGVLKSGKPFDARLAIAH